ncbi:Phasin protein [Bradyrhizobium sp. JYMT SZCCT0428]|uniref:Phasin protein n=1 Tax=Bradyrhizobium sp. JYMT SZCCT0428 TaxID=2807673 RepID=UPI001BA4C23A|nr:Phasin protein [Bradyrhizobium sp. JYMT SZCCT0428]MBR1157383.1 Phasin protein [Bradyrhizobium sp. JYMT SZCCT0428]
MTKRKSTTASKPARRLKIAAKAQRANSAVIRSPKPGRVRSVAADPIKSSPKGPNDPKHQAAIIESPAMELQDSLKKTVSEPDLRKGFDLSSATATARAYQAKLLEMAQANMQFALEFGPRLASIRSPFQLLRVIEELTKERIAMFRKYSNEMVQLSMKR